MALFCSFLCKMYGVRLEKVRVKYREGGIYVIYEVTEEAQSLLTLYDINRLLGRDSSRRLQKFAQ